MDQDKIKSWWFNMVSELTGQILALTEEVTKLRQKIAEMEKLNVD